MLPKQHRISTNTIQSVLKNGRFFHSQYGVLYVEKTPHTPDVKVAIVVGKKVSKHATRRNYLKRVARNVVLQNIPHIQPGVCFVLVLKPPIQSQPFRAIKQHIEHLFFVARIIK